METPFPLTSLTLVSSQEYVGQQNTTQSQTLPHSHPDSIHCLEELFQLAFPKTFERRLRLVYCGNKES